MKKICYFINSDWYFDLHWLDRAKEAQHSGYSVVILTNFHDERLIKKMTDEGFECINSQMQERSINPILFLRDIVRCIGYLKKINPDLLVAITIKCLIIGGIYSKFYSSPVLLNFVGLGRVFNSKALINRVIKYFVIPCIGWIGKNKRSYFCFEHEYDRERLHSEVMLKRERSFVINGAGVDCDAYVMNPEPNNGTVVILYASRLIAKKGLPDLVVAIRELKREISTPIILRVAGISVPDDPDHISDAQIQQWQQQDDIEWIGKSDDIAGLLMNSHIVALPSTYPEGIPRILLEAFAAGRTTIAYDIDGCRSLISDSIDGVLVEAGNTIALKDNLKRLIENPELRQRLGSTARSTAIEKFSSKIINHQTVMLYEKILSEKESYVRK